MSHFRILASAILRGLSIAVAAAAAGLASAATEPKPNVIFFFAGDQRADTIAALGNPVIKTPNLDRLAHAGLADYHRYISYRDGQIGRVLDALEKSPYAKNTIVVFSADSGVARGSHGLIGKQNLYEFDSLRVPLIVAGPGIPANRTTDAMCYLFDVMPTLGKLCGVPAPKSSDGEELTRTLHDPSEPARSELVFAYRNVQRAINDGRWKLIRYPLVNKSQLFDLKNDPQEMRDLAGNPRYADKVRDLMVRLKTALANYGDTAPMQVDNPRAAAWMPPGKSTKPVSER